MTTETLVLGAGIVGVCVALHLRERGQSVALIDRNEPGEEASYGNAGLIERASVIPYAIPRHLPTLLAYASNRSAAVRYAPWHLPRMAGWVLRYWHASRHDRLMRSAHEILPLIEACLGEHDRLIAEAGLEHLIRRNGWIEVFRSIAAQEAAEARASALAEFDLSWKVLDRTALSAAEPALTERAVGAIHWTDPYTVSDPGALTKGYADLFEKKGGSFLRGAIAGIRKTRTGWQVSTDSGTHEATRLVIALGPHSVRLLEPLGYRVPLGIKRGYHMHFRPEGNAGLSHAILDEEVGYVLAPMEQGIRLTTGVELDAPDAPPNRIQLQRVERRARELFPLGQPVEDTPWLGLRSAMPDMKPVIGRAPLHEGLWVAFGHAHHGLTLGPVTGRLLAEMMTGEAPFADPAPFAMERFGKTPQLNTAR